MTSSSSPDIFLSYSRRNKDVQQRVVAWLREHGFTVWVDNERLTPGTPIWEAEIEAAIASASVTVVLLSPDAKQSEWVRAEVEYAKKNRKAIFPVLIAGDELSSVPLGLLSHQFADLRRDEQHGLDDLAAALRTRLYQLPHPGVRQPPMGSPSGGPIASESEPALLPMTEVSGTRRRGGARLGWILGALGVCVLAACATGLVVVLQGLLPAIEMAPTELPTATVSVPSPTVPFSPKEIPLATAPPATFIVPLTVVPPTESPNIRSSTTWTIDSAGVCRDDKGEYPRWTGQPWPFSQCEEACADDPNCQGFAMSKKKDYCQLMGSDGNENGSKPGVQITRGDQAQPDYACYLKSNDKSILAWTMDSTGVCRDAAGNYPQWSEYSWPFSQCEEACAADPNCQGFAMSKEKDYCQLMGSDGQRDGTNPDTYITRGDSSQPQYTCFIKR